MGRLQGELPGSIGSIPNLRWATGDTNFDGVINFDDYAVVDQAFFSQGAPLSGQESEVAAVPEPGTWILAAMAFVSLVLIGPRTACLRTRKSVP